MNQLSNKMKKTFDLEERTINFSKNVLTFCKLYEKDRMLYPMLIQLVRSASSIGANYVEANNSCSKKDFRNKIYICKKESQETKYWLKVIKSTVNIEKVDILWQEAHELNLIFQKIVTSLNENSKIK